MSVPQNVPFGVTGYRIASMKTSTRKINRGTTTFYPKNGYSSRLRLGICRIIHLSPTSIIKSFQTKFFFLEFLKTKQNIDCSIEQSLVQLSKNRHTKSGDATLRGRSGTPVEVTVGKGIKEMWACQRLAKDYLKGHTASCLCI